MEEETKEVVRTRPDYDSPDWWYNFFIGYTIGKMAAGEVTLIREEE